MQWLTPVFVVAVIAELSVPEIRIFGFRALSARSAGSLHRHAGVLADHGEERATARDGVFLLRSSQTLEGERLKYRATSARVAVPSSMARRAITARAYESCLALDGLARSSKLKPSSCAIRSASCASGSCRSALLGSQRTSATNCSLPATRDSSFAPSLNSAASSSEQPRLTN